MSNLNTPTKPRYRAPSTHASVEICLDEFDDAQIIEYLKQQGHEVDGSRSSEEVDADGVWISQAELSRVSTLHLCGQRAEAHEVIFEIVSSAIGRNIA